MWHVHFKDCEPEVAAEARRTKSDYFTAVRSGVFCELGRGIVDFPGLVDSMRRSGYDGWIVVEQDYCPRLARRKRVPGATVRYLRTLGL